MESFFASGEIILHWSRRMRGLVGKSVDGSGPGTIRSPTKREVAIKDTPFGE